MSGRFFLASLTRKLRKGNKEKYSKGDSESRSNVTKSGIRNSIDQRALTASPAASGAQLAPPASGGAAAAAAAAPAPMGDVQLLRISVSGRAVGAVRE